MKAESDPRIVLLEAVYQEGFLEDFQKFLQGHYHTHLFCHRGNIHFLHNNKKLSCKGGQFLFWFADSKVTELNCTKNFKATVLFVEKDFLNNNNPDQSWAIDALLYSKEHPVKMVSKEDKHRILGNFRNLIKRFHEIDHYFYEELLKRQMQIFILEMWHTFANVYEHHKRSLQSGTLYDRFIQLVKDHCMVEREVRFYANQLHITAKYLNHICKTNTGITASEWIQRYTKDRLILLLQNKNLNISEIADKMEFSSRSFFTRYVKKLLGVTPKEYRERFR
ncbi:helix-turn-helix domain-containing protein [Aestuariivivens sediminicola]|uniref:helix-turn-helix domain-containing protein n=1 Tax=Aestuariivivens sediminicola TaxID=2913560 RepID=UPI001F56485D|nr:helix-turn-helix domain-containing protein [Aestuariivivens sediminicola]